MSFEEYRERVRAIVRDNCRAFAEQEVNHYLDGKEAEEFIKERYDADMRDIKNGRFTIDCIEDCAFSAGYCLALMF